MKHRDSLSITDRPFRNTPNWMSGHFFLFFPFFRSFYYFPIAWSGQSGIQMFARLVPNANSRAFYDTQDFSKTHVRAQTLVQTSKKSRWFAHPPGSYSLWAVRWEFEKNFEIDFAARFVYSIWASFLFGKTASFCSVLCLYSMASYLNIIGRFDRVYFRVTQADLN